MIAAPPRAARVEEAVAVAREILESEGRDGLTMRHLADRMGIRAPSLYKHIESKEELEALLIADAFRDFGQVFHDALADGRRSRRGPLRALARAYRGWALAHRTSTGWSPRGGSRASGCPRAWRRGRPSRS